MRVPRSLVDPRDPQSIVNQVQRLTSTVDGLLGFGSPQDPTDPQSTDLADGAAHNGSLENMDGSWVEVDVETLDAATTCTHNLAAPAISATASPNVRWLVFGYEHDGTGTTGASDTVSCNYETGDAITDDAIELRFYAANRTVDATHPLRVTLFFVRAVR